MEASPLAARAGGPRAPRPRSSSTSTTSGRSTSATATTPATRSCAPSPTSSGAVPGERPRGPLRRRGVRRDPRGGDARRRPPIADEVRVACAAGRSPGPTASRSVPTVSAGCAGVEDDSASAEDPGPCRRRPGDGQAGRSQPGHRAPDRSGGWPDREADHEAEPRPGALGRRDRAAVAVDDPARDGEAQAGATRPARAAPARTGRRRAAMSWAGSPGRSSSTIRTLPGRRPGRSTVHHSPRRAVADRVVDEDHHELAQPGRVADDHRRLRVERDADACARPPAPVRPRRPRPPRRRGRRARGQRDRAGVASGRAAAGRRRARSGGRPRRRCRRAPRRPGSTGSSRVAAQVLDASPDDGQRRPQLVAGVGGELALAAERVAGLGTRARRALDGARAERRQRGRRHAADEQDREQRVERLPLGRAVLDDLEEVPVRGRASTGTAQDADAASPWTSIVRMSAPAGLPAASTPASAGERPSAGRSRHGPMTCAARRCSTNGGSVPDDGPPKTTPSRRATGPGRPGSPAMNRVERRRPAGRAADAGGLERSAPTAT